MFRKIFFLLFSILLANHPAGAQASLLKFETISTAQGLSQSNVRSIYQDRTGFMWFGTNDGLNKYDGYSFTVYKRSVRLVNGLNSNDIQHLIGRGDTLWISTGEGMLNCMDLRKEKLYSNPTVNIHAIKFLSHDREGHCWAGTNEGKLYRIASGTNTSTSYSLPANSLHTPGALGVTCMVQLSDGTIWIGTAGGGIFVLQQGGSNLQDFPTVYGSPGLPDCQIRFLFEDSRKQIWAGTYGKGLFRYDRQTHQFQSCLLPLQQAISGNQPDYLLCMAEDQAGHLWMGTENNGLYILHPEKHSTDQYLHSETDAQSLGSNTINCIRKDLAGNMWLGTSDGGISVVNPAPNIFAHFQHGMPPYGLPGSIVNSFFEDHDNNIWIGTDGGGVCLFDEKTGMLRTLKHQPGNPQSIGSDYVLTTAQDNDGNIWIGTWGQGITVISPGNRFSHYKHLPGQRSSLSNNNAYRILKDRKGRMWVGTYGGGLDLYDPGTKSFRHFGYLVGDSTGISSNYILSLAEDRHGNLWIGTDGGGLNRFNETDQTFISAPYAKAGLSNNRITAIYEDAHGFLWLGTHFGLNKFDPRTGSNSIFTVENGLANDVIAAVQGDAENHIWISTNKGLSRIWAADSVQNFGVNDGLQENEFRSGTLFSSSGKIYFGGKKGFNVFAPANIRPHAPTRPVIFTNFQVFNKSVDVSDGNTAKSPLHQTISQTSRLVLPYHLSVFSLEFSSLAFTSREKSRYRYMLKGFDDTWHNLGYKNSVSFTNLNPGAYTLLVQSAANENQWTGVASSIEIIITPPFWKTWWFLTLEILLGAAAIAAIFYYRVAAIKKRNQLLEKEVAARTLELSDANAFLSESNERIQVQNIYLEESNQENLRKTEKILDQQRHILSQKQELEVTVNELRQSNNTKDKIFSILAHDLRNPITALHGISAMLYHRSGELSVVNIREQIKDIYNASVSIENLVSNLLHWASCQAYALTCHPQEINVSGMLARNIMLVESQLNTKHIGVKVEVEASHFAQGDRQMVDTMVRNLLSNSIKFTGKNGSITIISRETTEEIELTFQDNGVGMTAAQIKNLDQNQHVYSTYGTLGEKGIGLGLQIVKEFAVANKGRLTFSGEPGKGSAFTISLPKSANALLQITDANKASDYEPEAVRFRDDHMAMLKGKRILIVDDNEAVRNFLKLMLSDTFETFEAVNGKEGLLMARDIQPDMIITDLMMPVMNGLEFCREVKNDYNTSHIPLIIISGTSPESGQLPSFEAGSDAFLPKPIDQKMLIQIIVNLIRQQGNAKRRYSAASELYTALPGHGKLDDEFLQQVTRYIEESLSDTELDYKKISEITSLSRTVLYAKFKVLTGMGVHDFIKNIRLKKSVSLLQEGKMNISQIAYEVGFSTPSYFTKSFQKKYELTPKEYQANLRSRKKDNSIMPGDE